MRNKLNDHEIVKLLHVERGGNHAFDLIVESYKERLYWHIRKILINHDDTDDVLQNTFIKVWKGLPGFREESTLYTWIYRIATNEAFNFLKQKKTKFFLPILYLDKKLSESLTEDEYFCGDDIQLKLQKAILKLPEKQRLVFNMKYFDDMKYEEISQIIGITVGALKASYHHAVKKIEKYLTDN